VAGWFADCVGWLTAWLAALVGSLRWVSCCAAWLSALGCWLPHCLPGWLAGCFTVCLAGWLLACLPSWQAACFLAYLPAWLAGQAGSTAESAVV